MTRTSQLVGLALAVAVVAGFTLAVAGAGAQFLAPGDGPTTPANTDNHSEQPVGVPDGGVGAGEQLAGLVATADQTVRGSVDRGAFQAALEAAGSPAQRAEVVDSRLSTTDERLTELERTVTELAASRPASGKTARAVSAGAEAEALARLLGDIETAVPDLPATQREQRNLTARLEEHQQRAEAIRERTRQPRELINGANTETWADPVTIADVEEAADRSMASVSGAERFFGSEQVDLHVRRANGSRLRLAIDTGGGEVTSIERGPHDNPTVRVYTDYGVIRTLQRTDDPGGALSNAVDNNRVVYDGAGLLQSIRYGGVSVFEFLGS
jgi:hypothetical protein